MPELGFCPVPVVLLVPEGFLLFPALGFLLLFRPILFVLFVPPLLSFSVKTPSVTLPFVVVVEDWRTEAALCCRFVFGVSANFLDVP